MRYSKKKNHRQLHNFIFGRKRPNDSETSAVLIETYMLFYRWKQLEMHTWLYQAYRKEME